jgi:hypothetical protein
MVTNDFDDVVTVILAVCCVSLLIFYDKQAFAVSEAYMAGDIELGSGGLKSVMDVSVLSSMLAAREH